MFSLRHVRSVGRDRNITNGREITLKFRQNRQMITTCVYLGLFRRWNTRALHSARIMQWKERLNVEISQTGGKYRLIIEKIDEWLQFACVWSSFDAGKRVHYVLHVK